VFGIVEASRLCKFSHILLSHSYFMFLLCTNHALLVRLQALHSNSSNSNNDGGSLLSAPTKSTPLEVSSTVYCNNLKEVATICFHLPFITLLPYTTLHIIILPIFIIIKAKPTMASNLMLA
jgi:hypothetical protein